MKDPPPNDVISFPWQTKPDEFGLWNKSTSRPTSDRFFCPSQGSSDDSKESFLTSPPASCADPKFKKLLESKLLVRGISGGKKALELSDPVFEKNQVTFKEIPLFAITEHQAKLSLGNLAAMSQVCSGIQDYLTWIVDNSDQKKDLSTYDGFSSPGDRSPADPLDHANSVRRQITDGMNSGSSWLFET